LLEKNIQLVLQSFKKLSNIFNYSYGDEMKKILLLLTLISLNAYAQFDSLIFLKSVNLNYTYTDIYQLGDQNADGFDDIIIYDCEDEKAMIFLSGNPMDTIPILAISINRVNIAALDLNDDDMKDIVIVDRTERIIKVFYGGSLLDTIPDIQFYPPAGHGIGWTSAVLDFNGDERSEYTIYHPNLPFSSKQYGTLYFYNTESQFDTIPHYVITGDSVKKIKIAPMDPGDLNGDNKSDFMIYSIVEGPPQRFYRSFYLGNESWDFTPAQTFYQDEHTFEMEGWQIINDINGDGKDDIKIKDYGFYPYYYYNAILHGSFPIDTIPDVGLNTQNLGLGHTVSLGDVNGDGYNDFFGKDGASYPNVKLWVGGRNMPYTSDDQANKTWFGTSGGFGRVISNVGDVDGDSVNDIAICEIPYGAPADCKPGLVYIFRGDTSVIGDTGTVSINDNDIIPIDYQFIDPYPNPFNPSTNLSFFIGQRSFISLKVYDMLGKEVANLLNEEKPSGKFELEFNADDYNLSSGIYLVNFRIMKGGAEVFYESKKIILLK
jgi:hypothetical protein